LEKPSLTPLPPPLPHTLSALLFLVGLQASENGTTFLAARFCALLAQAEVFSHWRLEKIAATGVF
jgi:hypothetical protein